LTIAVPKLNRDSVVRKDVLLIGNADGLNLAVVAAAGAAQFAARARWAAAL